MFGLGMPEILLILAIALIVIGPKKLPDLAKTLGRAMGEFKRSAQDFKRSIDIETTVNESATPPPAKDLKEVIKDVNEPKDPPSDPEKPIDKKDQPDDEQTAKKPPEQDAQFTSDTGTPAEKS